MPSSREQDLDVVDVAIVGAGASGTYAAYRLTHAAPDASPVMKALHDTAATSGGRPVVRLYEASDRIGGRLWSMAAGANPDIKIEFGGQAFPQIHQNVYGLCHHLKLKVRPSPVFNGGPQFCYLRRHHLALADLAGKSAASRSKAKKVPYYLLTEEQGKGPSRLVQEAVERAIPRYKQIRDELTGELGKELDRAASSDAPVVFDDAELGHILRSVKAASLELQTATVSKGHSGNPLAIGHGFWNLLQHELSTEAYWFIVDCWATASDYQSSNLYQSCVAQLRSPFMMPFWELADGYQTLPLELERRFRANGGTTSMHHRLIKVRRKDGGVRLTFVDHEGDRLRKVQCQYLIMAMPPYAVGNLNRQSVIFRSADFRSDLAAVKPVPAYKLVLGYDDEWWAREPAPGRGITPPTSGFSLTDTPIRGCYYLGQNEGGLALMYASIGDSITQQFWSAFLSGAHLGSTEDGGGPGVLRATPSSKGSVPVPPQLETSVEMRAMVRRLLAQMHGKDVPEPEFAAFANWSLDPYGGGWHVWNPHVATWNVMPRVQRLGVDEDPRIFMCGEAFSADQGWVEGAVNTAETVLQDHFGLPPAGWVHADYDFGRLRR